MFTNKKSQETYAEVPRQLQHLTDNVPHSIMGDFQQGMIVALNQEHPSLPPKGCLFRLSKSIYRHVQELGLSQSYMNDEQFRTNIRIFER